MLSWKFYPSDHQVVYGQLEGINMAITINWPYLSGQMWVWAHICLEQFHRTIPILARSSEEYDTNLKCLWNEIFYFVI